MKLNFGIGLTVFLLGMGVGFVFTPEYAQMMASKTSPMVELGMPDKQFDLRYINNMIAHHLSAIDMCQQALAASRRPEITQLAQAIIAADERGIQELYAMKKSWYGDTRQVSRFEKQQLGIADELFDLRFLNAMIFHHTMAIDSAREVRQKSTRTEILTLAQSVESGLTANKTQLEAWRTAWYEN